MPSLEEGLSFPLSLYIYIYRRSAVRHFSLNVPCFTNHPRNTSTGAGLTTSMSVCFPTLKSRHRRHALTEGRPGSPLMVQSTQTATPQSWQCSRRAINPNRLPHCMQHGAAWSVTHSHGCAGAAPRSGDRMFIAFVAVVEDGEVGFAADEEEDARAEDVKTLLLLLRLFIESNAFMSTADCRGGDGGDCGGSASWRSSSGRC